MEAFWEFNFSMPISLLSSGWQGKLHHKPKVPSIIHKGVKILCLSPGLEVVELELGIAASELIGADPQPCKLTTCKILGTLMEIGETNSILQA